MKSNNKFEKHNLINLIRNLPDYLMEDAGIFLPWNSPDKHEREFLSSIREVHRGHADWLEYYLQDKNELLPELIFTNKINFKMFGERTTSHYRLAQEVWLKSAKAQELNLEPLIWTALIETDIARIKLKNSYWQPINNYLGKVEYYKLVKQHYDNLENSLRKIIDQNIFGLNKSPSFLSTTETVTYFQLLEIEANKIAQFESDFRNKNLNDYHKEQKRFYAQLKNSKLQSTYMNSEGILKTMRNGVRGKAKSNKGFK